VPRAIDGVAGGLLRIAEDCMIDFARLNAAATAPSSWAVKSRSFPQ